MKLCSHCKTEKSYDCYAKNKRQTDGYHYYCKDCTKAHKAKRKDKNAEYQKKWISANIEHKRAYERQYYKDNQDTLREKRAQVPLEVRRKHNNRPEKRAKEAIIRTTPEYKEKRRLYIRERYHSDPSYKISKILRARLRGCINNESKRSGALDLLGISVNRFKSYLENIFLKGMTWENHGTVWHIDHIKPCYTFDLNDYEQQKICFHYTNMQPLYAITTIVDGVEYIGNLNKNKY